MTKPTKFWAATIEALEDEGYSLREIARLLESTPGTISDIKSGRTKAPTGMIAVKLYAHAKRLETLGQ